MSPARLSILALLLVCAGCATPRTIHPASSSLTKEAALGRIVLARESAYVVADTGSMRPTFDEHAVLSVEHAEWGALRAGDIVLYQSVSGRTIVHRLVRWTDRGWLAQGDANAEPDTEQVTPANYSGRVCAIYYTTQQATTGYALSN